MMVLLLGLQCLLKWITRQKPKELIVAVPVTTRESVDKLSQVADRIIVIHCCSSYDNVGEHYRDFTEVRDDEVERLMKKSPFYNFIRIRLVLGIFVHQPSSSIFSLVSWHKPITYL
jgi:hypothetical protein